MTTALSTANSKPGTAVICDLAAKINAEHQSCLSAASQTLDHALRCGDLLAQAKAECSHGRWQTWLRENFQGSERTARVYMRLAENRQMIEAKRQSLPFLSIDTATQLLTVTKEDETFSKGECDAQDWFGPLFPPGYRVSCGEYQGGPAVLIGGHDSNATAMCMTLVGAIFSDDMTKEEWEGFLPIITRFSESIEHLLARIEVSRRGTA